MLYSRILLVIFLHIIVYSDNLKLSLSPPLVTISFVSMSEYKLCPLSILITMSWEMSFHLAVAFQDPSCCWKDHECLHLISACSILHIFFYFTFTTFNIHQGSVSCNETSAMPPSILVICCWITILPQTWQLETIHMTHLTVHMSGIAGSCVSWRASWWETVVKEICL